MVRLQNRTLVIVQLFSVSLMCYNIAYVLCLGLFFFFFFFLLPGILAPQPWIKPTLPASEGKTLTSGPPGKSHTILKHTPVPIIHYFSETSTLLVEFFHIVTSALYFTSNLIHHFYSFHISFSQHFFQS